MTTNAPRFRPGSFVRLLAVGAPEPESARFSGRVGRVVVARKSGLVLVELRTETVYWMAHGLEVVS